MSGTCSFRLCVRPLIAGLATCDKHRVYVAPVKPELEMPIKRRIQAALRAAGCMAMVHNIDNRALHTGLTALGVSDIICIVPPYGRFLAIEVKRPKYSPSDVTKDQRAFLSAVRKFGGVAGIATSEKDALVLMTEAAQCRPPADDVARRT